MPQLDKCLKLKSIRGGGDKNDCTPYKITPGNAINFGHISSCGTIVPELQSFEDNKIKAKSADKKQGNQSKSMKIDQICDVTCIACRFNDN